MTCARIGSDSTKQGGRGEELSSGHFVEGRRRRRSLLLSIECCIEVCHETLLPVNLNASALRQAAVGLRLPLSADKRHLSKESIQRETSVFTEPDVLLLTRASAQYDDAREPSAVLHNRIDGLSCRGPLHVNKHISGLPNKTAMQTKRLSTHQLLFTADREIIVSEQRCYSSGR